MVYLFAEDHLQRNIVSSRWNQTGIARTYTYHNLAFTLEIACNDALEGVVGFALAEGGAVDVGGEEAEGGENAGIKSSLSCAFDR